VEKRDAGLPLPERIGPGQPLPARNNPKPVAICLLERWAKSDNIRPLRGPAPNKGDRTGCYLVAKDLNTSLDTLASPDDDTRYHGL
jgi:hypothetical protein